MHIVIGFNTVTVTCTCYVM